MHTWGFLLPHMVLGCDNTPPGQLRLESVGSYYAPPGLLRLESLGSAYTPPGLLRLESLGSDYTESLGFPALLPTCYIVEFVNST